MMPSVDKNMEQQESINWYNRDTADNPYPRLDPYCSMTLQFHAYEYT